MKKLIIHHDRIDDPEKWVEICPFGALEVVDGKLEINAACKMCSICIKQGPKGAFESVETDISAVAKEEWKGVAVYVDHLEGNIHPVTYELLGKAGELARKLDHPVYALFSGSGIIRNAEKLRYYGADEIIVYDHPALEYFRIEPYAAVFEDFIIKRKPAIVLAGGTTVGRSLAPRVAARFRTGLTADCTLLEVRENTDLDQIRPAYGGNIMAHIHTPNHRPQFATVRYKIFPTPERRKEPSGTITRMQPAEERLKSRIDVREIRKKEQQMNLEDAEIIVVAGRGVKKKEDLLLIRTLAAALGGQTAATRPLIENGWADPRNQIGLSGRTVKPKMIITCGVSGSIQFVAGMQNSDYIIAINTDENAPIMKVAHLGLAGDLYEIIPRLLAKMTADPS
ncbi:electron transfer flavoprotein subunit alpha [bacterium]|nr:electron transfer flavoprotein subunit alpha [bacterium]